MKISPVKIISNNDNLRFKANRLYLSPSSDSISFSSNYEQREKRIQNAVDFGFEMYTKSVNIQKFKAFEYVSRKLKMVQVLPIQQLKQEVGSAHNYIALFRNKYDSNFKPVSMKLYISEKPKNPSKMSKLIYSMEIAHEYTHYLQEAEGTASECLKTLSGGDTQYSKLLIAFGNAVFAHFDNEIENDLVFKTIDFVNIKNLIKGQIVPSKEDIDKEKFLRQNMYSQDSFNRYINLAFDIIFNDTYRHFLANIGYADEDILNAHKAFISKGYSKEKLKENVRKYCAFLAQCEFEAYTTESQLAKKALDTKDSLNIDVFSIYYDMLNSALNCKSK